MDKKFLDLLSVLDTGLDETEGGTHCVFYTPIHLMSFLLIPRIRGNHCVNRGV